MVSDDIERMKHLTELNDKIGKMEQQGRDAVRFFDALLSDQLIFRRANGKVVGKAGPGGFLDGLTEPNPFTSRDAEDIAVRLVEDRALVTLIVIATHNDGSVHRYRNIRLFSRSGDNWILELWYNYDITSL